MRAVDATMVGFRAGEKLDQPWARELEWLRRRMEKLERSMLARQRTEAPQETCQAGLSHGEVPRAQCVRRAREALAQWGEAWLLPSERWLLVQDPEEGPGVHVARGKW